MKFVLVNIVDEFENKFGSFINFCVTLFCHNSTDNGLDFVKMEISVI